MGPANSAAPRILASTTAHKREPLLDTLEMFGRLGLCDLDLNLHHLIEGAVPVSSVVTAADAHGLRVWALSGGWCDFYHRAPEVEDTFASVARQVGIAGELGAVEPLTEYRLFERSSSRTTTARRSIRPCAARFSIAWRGRTSA